MEQQERKVRVIMSLLQDLFEISAVYRQNQRLVFSLNCRYQRERSVKMITDRLQTAGYRFRLDNDGDMLLLNIDPRARVRIPPLNIILFLATLFTVYVVSVFFRFILSAPSFEAAVDGALQALSRGAGLVFTLALMSILIVHEMGHYIASRRRNIVTTWPYFIPAPTLIGTFGAVIKSKSPFWNRRDLIEVGAAGPIAGWLVALAWLWYGLSQTGTIAPDVLEPGAIPFGMEGESILMRLSTWLLVGPAPAGHVYSLSEAAFAGWVGLLVTAINMLPIGMLDGGHVVYGLLKRRQHLLGKLAVLGLLALGFQTPMWWLFAGFGLFLGMNHPPTLNDGRPLSRAAKIMGWVALVILALSFTPMPFR
ncbi:MAG: site-2 protease family protein [candidate division Zixibacteria bacterium]|nr:site-2 protease family protein [candidate division Zixibacteria bacterium]MDH3936093.1 site-2 protease family protein [candidate division Zixibacteria bacterium]MDH4032239.1 site-2 protease family protein [candidate division Zixibacteria bacterium]